MNAAELIAGLGKTLNLSLELSKEGTCRVYFDDDMVDFEQAGEDLYIMADIASAINREDAYGRLLAANCLGAETGGACIGLDSVREVFTLHTVIRGEMPSPAFEQVLAQFIKALRYWKEWLALPPVSQPAAKEEPLPFTEGMIRI